jgi:hypothetical protein
MMRSPRAVLVGGSFLVGLLASPSASAPQVEELPKDLVMASLPALIDSILGPADAPVTVRLSRHAHVRPIFQTSVPVPTAHGQAWLERQLATPFVLDLCDSIRPADCSVGAATMVIGISEPSMEPDGRARVIVWMGRRDTAVPTGPAAFAAEFVVWLRRESGLWTYDGYRVLEIT